MLAPLGKKPVLWQDALEQGLQFVEAKRFEVKFLEPVSYLMGAPALGQSLVELDTHDETVGELLDWAVHEFSSSRRLSYDRIVQALLLSTFPVPQQCSRGRGVGAPVTGEALATRATHSMPRPEPAELGPLRVGCRRGCI